MPAETFSLPPVPLVATNEDPYSLRSLNEAMGQQPDLPETHEPPVVLEEPRTATEASLGIGDPAPTESLTTLNESFPEERLKAQGDFNQPLVEEQKLLSSEETTEQTFQATDRELTDLNRLRRIDGVPGAKAMLDFGTSALSAVDSAKVAYATFMDIRRSPILNRLSEGIHSTSERFKSFLEARDVTAAEVRKRGPEYGFHDVKPLAVETVPVIPVELSQPQPAESIKAPEILDTKESKETPSISTPERIRQVFDTIEGMNQEGGSFDQFASTLKRFQEEYDQPEIAEAALVQMFGDNAEIAKTVMEQGLKGSKKYQQDLESLGVDAATTELAWEKRLSNKPTKAAESFSTDGQEETENILAEPKAVVEAAPRVRTVEEQKLQRQQELREHLRTGEGLSKSDLSLQSQGALLFSEGARLRAKLESDPADELGSYYRQSERIGKTDRQFEAHYDGSGETTPRTEAALADINVKSEVLSLLAEAQGKAGESGDSLALFQEKLRKFVGASTGVTMERDSDVEGQPLKTFEPSKMTLGIEYSRGRLTVAIKRKQEGDASTESTLQNRSVYTEQ